MRKSTIDEFKKRIDSMDKGVDGAFEKVRDELDEHRDAINQNTSELTAAYQYIAMLEKKIEKLSERVDELTVNVRPELSAYDNLSVSLTIREQEVFLLLYTANKGLDLTEIAKYLGLTEELVRSYLFKLISKGVPIKKFRTGHDIFTYVLDKTFKDIQARKNIVPIDERVLAELGEMTV
ncbi:MAG: hypothetical protein ACQESE_03220 [Nanobdellota archaeon]